MEGVVSRVNHIQAIHSQRPILRSMKLLGSPEFFCYNGWNFSGWRINVFKMKGLIVHPVVREYLCGILKVPKVPNGVPLHWSSQRTWSWCPSALVSTFGKEELGVLFPSLASSLPYFLTEGLSLKFFILDS